MEKSLISTRSPHPSTDLRLFGSLALIAIAWILAYKIILPLSIWLTYSFSYTMCQKSCCYYLG
jgi:hypothetical protein